jgi:hypothetical protein
MVSTIVRPASSTCASSTSSGGPHGGGRGEHVVERAARPGERAGQLERQLHLDPHVGVPVERQRRTRVEDLVVEDHAVVRLGDARRHLHDLARQPDLAADDPVPFGLPARTPDRCTA